MTSRAKNAGFEKEQMQLLDDIERKQDFDPNEAPTRISSKIPRDVIGIGINRPSLCC
jgi:tetrahydromethanopterin S-methyltransferase subunit G